MGKKSLVDAPLLPVDERHGVDALGVSLPAEQSALEELVQELVRVALRTHVDTQESRSKKEVNNRSTPKNKNKNSVSVCLFY